MELGHWIFFNFNSLKVTIKCLEKLNSYSVCSDCESELKIELVKILKKFITKDQATLLEILLHFDLTPASEHELKYLFIYL